MATHPPPLDCRRPDDRPTRPVPPPVGRLNQPAASMIAAAATLAWASVYPAVVRSAVGWSASRGVPVPWGLCAAGFFAGGIVLPYAFAATFSRRLAGHVRLLSWLAMWSLAWFFFFGLGRWTLEAWRVSK